MSDGNRGNHSSFSLRGGRTFGFLGSRGSGSTCSDAPSWRKDKINVGADHSWSGEDKVTSPLSLTNNMQHAEEGAEKNCKILDFVGKNQAGGEDALQRDKWFGEQEKNKNADGLQVLCGPSSGDPRNCPDVNSPMQSAMHVDPKDAALENKEDDKGNKKNKYKRIRRGDEKSVVRAEGEKLVDVVPVEKKRAHEEVVAEEADGAKKQKMKVNKEASENTSVVEAGLRGQLRGAQ